MVTEKWVFRENVQSHKEIFYLNVTQIVSQKTGEESHKGDSSEKFPYVIVATNGTGGKVTVSFEL